MASRGRHVGGALWSAITILIAAVAMTAPQRAHAGVMPLAPSALAQAGLAAAQNAVGAAAAAVSAAQPGVAVPTVTGVAPASSPVTTARAAATPPAAATQAAARPAASTAGAASRVPRPPAHPARAADPNLPVAESAARAGASTAPAVTPVAAAPAAPVRMAPVSVVPMAPMPVVPAPVVVTVSTVHIPAIAIPWPEGWASVGTTAWPSLPVASPALGDLAAMGWPLGLAGPTVSGVTPASADPLGSGLTDPLGVGVAAPLGGWVSPAGGLPHQRHPRSGTGHDRATHRRLGTHATSGSRRVLAAPAPPPWLGQVARPPLPARGPARLEPQPRRHGAGPPRPAHATRSAAEPSSSPPPLSFPMTGSGPAAAAAAGGGGGAAAALMTVAALLLIFLLSTRVSLDVSAWRSTLLSLRLERPG
jgi:hypothetical protein